MTITSRARTAGHRATDSTALEGVARVGFVARGAIYVLIGVIAVQIAVGRGGQADRGGALTQIAAHTYGVVALWLLVIGFGGLALWRCGAVARQRSGVRRPRPGRSPRR
jgi:hypothetical protein